MHGHLCIMEFRKRGTSVASATSKFACCRMCARLQDHCDGSVSSSRLLPARRSNQPGSQAQSQTGKDSSTEVYKVNRQDKTHGPWPDLTDRFLALSPFVPPLWGDIPFGGPFRLPLAAYLLPAFLEPLVSIIGVLPCSDLAGSLI